MATYDTTAPAAPFARSRLRFESLVGDLSGGGAGQMTHDQLEELVEDQGRELQRQLLQDHLDLRAAAEEQALPAAGEARRAAGAGRAGPRTGAGYGVRPGDGAAAGLPGARPGGWLFRGCGAVTAPGAAPPPAAAGGGGAARGPRL